MNATSGNLSQNSTILEKAGRVFDKQQIENIKKKIQGIIENI